MDAVETEKLMDEYESSLFEGLPVNHPVIIKNEKEDRPSVIMCMMDAEYDPIVIEYDQCGVVTFNCENYEYLMLTVDKLDYITFSAEKAKELWETLDKYWAEDEDDYVGWEHLAVR